MNPPAKPPRLFCSVALIALIVLSASSASTASAGPPEVGATVPDLSLPALDDSEHTLSEREGPTVLVFFRGAW